MHGNLVCVTEGDMLVDAARKMDEYDIGDVLVIAGDGKLCGIVTDRDIVVRAIALGKDPARTKVGEICTASVATLSPDADLDEAVRLMEQKAVRRIPIVQGDKPLGIISIGDLARERDRQSALGQISAAPPNN
jgi:CBS domain-containing protein